ncbi:dad family protein [Stylonychia lemnae]|uniref:Dolichyl-diphosphooligosaccharide--protein glycosyltransferase subunit OST2 n=1 Tax=Stylonychia lemnae TaxID=5949 RepID=A0A078B5W2_STYLE|nr:dad family protein [Stylonychia lemnae]|eukprot:CDW89895.1 dad family protein [Stylonychia lemnae]
MKQVEKFVGVNMNDVRVVLPALKEASARIFKEYLDNTHPKLKMLDGLIILSIATFVIQLVYSQVAGKDPFNSLLAGLFCSLGQFALSASLRIQLSDDEYRDFSNKKAIGEFILGSFLLYLSCLCLVG